MKMRRDRKRWKGFTLIEMVCVMAVLGLLLMFGTSLIVTVMRTGSLAERTGDRVNRRAGLAKQFRQDVGRAKVAPVKVGDLEAGPTLLGLTMPDGPTVIYRWDENGLTRMERNGDKETSQRIPLETKGTVVEFTRPAAGSRLITLRITESPIRGPVIVTEFSATIGGDYR